MVSEFQKNFKLIRKTLGWSQGKTAKELGFQPAAISHFETGQREPALKNLIKICKGFRISPNILLGWNDD